MSIGRIIVVLALILITAVIGLTDAVSYLTIENFKNHQADIKQSVDSRHLLAVSAYLITYITVTALSIPGAAVLTLIGGALFGVLEGTLLVSFASTIGASSAFVISRYLLRDAVEGRFSGAAEKINSGIKKDGAFYLFGLRLVPLFPFFVINLAMGLTRFPFMKFFWVSQLGMLPGTLVYVNAGTQLSNLESINGILSIPIIGSFVLLAIFPLLAKKLLKLWQQQRAFKEFKRPSHFDSNLIVIGAGAAGLVTAYIAAASKARVILIERDKMGGDCLNTGCVPSKALIQSSRIMHYIKRSQEFGIEQGVSPTANFPAVMQRIKEVIKDIEHHDSIERYTGLGVDCVTGNAIITSPWTVEVDGHEYSARSIVIATGGKPFIPPILGLDSCERLTSDTLWQLEELPEKLLVLGGGFIGCELAQAFQRLGSSVTIIEAAERLLMPEDSDVAAELTESFVADGINVITGHKVIEFKDSLALCEDGQGNMTKVAFDKVLVATGRVANTDGLGLENIALDLNKNGTVPVNDFLQSRYPNIYACGDVAGPFQLTHAAAHQAWYCAVNALFGALKSFRADYRVIPHGVFTEPEIARVGINEKEALTKGIAYETNIFRLDDLDRAIADSNTNGFIKVLTPPGKDKILGATIVGPHATDLLGEFTLAMRHNLGLRKILATIHPYPTYGEANKYAASLWQQRYLPQKLLNLSAAYNKWRRK